MDGSAPSAPDSTPVTELLFGHLWLGKVGPRRSFQGRKPECRPAGEWVPAARSSEYSLQRCHTLQVKGHLFNQECGGQLFCCESCHHFFSLFSYSGSIHLDFPLLWFSLCFHNLSTPGWSGFRQAAASAGSHRVHVLMEEMWPERCHPTHGKEVTATQGGEMYGLYP